MTLVNGRHHQSRLPKLYWGGPRMSNTPGGQNSGAEGHPWAQLPGLRLQSLPLACQSFHEEIKSENRYKPFFSSLLRTKRLDRDAHYLFPYPCHAPPRDTRGPVCKDQQRLISAGQTERSEPRLKGMDCPAHGSDVSVGHGAFASMRKL